MFVASGGVRCFSSAVLDCSSARMQEAMMASLLYLFDTAQRRELSKLNLRFLIAPYSDFHYKHYADSGDGNNTSADTTDDRELRLLCAKQALLTVLRSWSGVLHVMSCKILEDLVSVLLPCHLETRASCAVLLNYFEMHFILIKFRIEINVRVFLYVAALAPSGMDRRILSGTSSY